MTSGRPNPWWRPLHAPLARGQEHRPGLEGHPRGPASHVADAMPFFERAEKVLVLEVCGEKDEADAAVRTEAVAQALRRHGVAAAAQVAAHKPADGHEILRQASLFGADLIVAGAYGHSRLGEWAFGHGVTRRTCWPSTRRLHPVEQLSAAACGRPHEGALVYRGPGQKALEDRPMPLIAGRLATLPSCG